MPSKLASIVTIISAVVIVALQFSALTDGDIGSEITSRPVPVVEIPADLRLSSDGRRKAEALASFAQAYLKIKEANGFTTDVFDRLLQTIENDPTSDLPLNLLMTGWGTQGKERYAETVDKLFPIARSHPDAPKLNLVTVFALMKLDRLDDAIVLLKNSLSAIKSKEKPDAEDDKLMLDMSLALAGLYERERDYDQGDEILEEFLDDPKYKDNLKVLEAASLFYNKAADDASDSSWIWFVESDKERFTRKRGETFSALTTLCETRKMTMSELAGVLDLFRKEKRFDESLSMVLNNILRDPENTGALVLLAALYYDAGQPGKSYRIWKRLIEREKNDKKREFYHLEMGRSALTAHYYELAVSALEWYLMLNPKDQLAAYQLGLAFFELRDFKKAERQFEKVDDIPQAKYFLSLSRRFLGDYAGAVTAMEEARKIAEKRKDDKFLDKNFALTFAYACEKAGELNKMSDCLLEMLEKNPDDAETANFLGYVWADHDMNLDKAKELIERALKTDPDNSAYLDSMAWILYRKKEFKMAAEYINKSLEREGELPDAVILDHAGDIYRALGDDETAARHWRRALEIYSEDVPPEAIQKKIDALRSKRSSPPSR